MLRAILSVIAGYVGAAIVTFALLTLTWLALGADGAFKEGSFHVSTTWLTVSVAVSLIAAVAAGLVCAVIARPGSVAPMVLAGLFLVLGLVVAVWETMTREDEVMVREGEVTMMEAMESSQQPPVSLWLTPIIGAAGVMLGARLVPRRSASAPARDASV